MYHGSWFPTERVRERNWGGQGSGQSVCPPVLLMARASHFPSQAWQMWQIKM